MKVSVIVPVYNCAPYIERCINSITQQTHKDIEVILVNDGSTDESGDLCDKAALQDDRIKVIHKQNGGVSAARNTGIENAGGDIITFVDADDSIDPEMYEILLKLMVEHGADIIHCGYKHIVRDEIRLINDTKNITVQNREDALNCLISGKLFTGSACSKLFRRDLLNGIRFDEKLKFNEDILFCFEAFSAANRIVFADHAFYNYYARIGESASFSEANNKVTEDACAVSGYMYRCAKGTPYESAAAERYIRSLSGQYRYCCKNDKKACREIRQKLKEVTTPAKIKDPKMRMTSLLIRRFPGIYRLVYSAYSSVRKPNWEVKKN